MKDWFGYEYGYVNIDGDQLYLTNTGNWSETKDLQEKKRGQRKNSLKKVLIYIFILCIVLAGIRLFLFMVSEIRYGLIGMVALVSIGGYFAYKYLKPELGASFLIPMSKISAIHIENERAILEFRNGNDEADSVELTGIERKGIDLLNQLKPRIENA